MGAGILRHNLFSYFVCTQKPGKKIPKYLFILWYFSLLHWTQKKKNHMPERRVSSTLEKCQPKKRLCCIPNCRSHSALSSSADIFISDVWKVQIFEYYSWKNAVCQSLSNFVMNWPRRQSREINDKWIISSRFSGRNPIVTIEIRYFTSSYRYQMLNVLLNMSMTDDICLVELKTFFEPSEMLRFCMCQANGIMFVYQHQIIFRMLYFAQSLSWLNWMVARHSKLLCMVSVFILHAIGYHNGDEA